MNTSESNVPVSVAGFENDRPLPDWWTPVWKGLVLDREGRHYRAVGSAVWLLLYLFLCADRSTGTLKRKIETISRGMGVKVRTVRLWLKSLRQGGYVDARTNGRCLVIAIRKWKSYPQRQPFASQSGHSLAVRVTQECQSAAPKNGQRTAQPSQDSASGFAPYDTIIKKKKYKYDNVRDLKSQKEQEDAFAKRICQTFMDQANLPLYLAYIRQYPKEIIQKAFKAAIKMPANKIKKTRGALFNYLVQYYAREQTPPQNHSH